MGCFSSSKSAAAFVGELRRRDGMERKEMTPSLVEEAFDTGAVTPDEVMELLAAEDELIVSDELKALPAPLEAGLMDRFLDALRGSNHEKSAINRENGIDYPTA